MTPREQLLVERLVERLVEQPQQSIDAEVQREIERLMRRRADAPYLLLQRALQLEEALKLAYEEIERLRRQGAPGERSDEVRPGARAPLEAAAVPGTGFGRSAGAAARPGASGGLPAGAAAAPIGTASLGPAPFGTAMPGMAAGGGSSFLRNAAAAAAGVVGGSLLFRGIENLLHPQGSGLLGGGSLLGEGSLLGDDSAASAPSDGAGGSGDPTGLVPFDEGDTMPPAEPYADAGAAGSEGLGAEGPAAEEPFADEAGGGGGLAGWDDAGAGDAGDDWA